MDLIQQSDEIIENPCIKVVVIGSESVGKSSVINQLCGRDFDPDIKQTICYKIDNAEYKLKDSIVTVDYWDCGAYHNNSYEDVKSAFYRGSLFALIVLDGNDFNSLEDELKNWINDCDDFGACQKYIIINKMDVLDGCDYKSTNKTLSIGFSIEAKEQIQLTDLQTKPLNDNQTRIQNISNVLDSSKLRYFFGSAKDQQQGYKKVILQLLQENSIYNLQRYESDKKGSKKAVKEPVQSSVQEEKQSAKCLIQ